MHYLVIILVLIAVVLWGRLRKQKRRAHIKGWVETADLNGKSRHIYRDAKAGVSCKPDVVVRSRVIEYKSASVEGKARWVDLLQLALQLKTTGKPEGELRYSNKSFVFQRDDSEIKAAMRNALKIADRMRWHLLARIAPKATPSPRRCAKCVFMKECPEAAH
jgi:CRISPR/Cas system-associated exonuclease Cas4 (RecB family)